MASAMASTEKESCEASEARLARWRAKWSTQQTNFHLDEEHPVLGRHFERLALPPRGGRILLPLCGKSLDLEALANRGYEVWGVDGAEAARTTFAAEHDAVVEDDAVVLSTGARIGFYVGDFLGVSAADLSGTFDGAFDRGGLVAVSPEDRVQYAASLSALVSGRVLIVAVEHDPFDGGKLGPPFSVDESQVRALFAADFEITLLEREDRMPHETVWRERGCERFDETTYLLTRRT